MALQACTFCNIRFQEVRQKGFRREAGLASTAFPTVMDLRQRLMMVGATSSKDTGEEDVTPLVCTWKCGWRGHQLWRTTRGQGCIRTYKRTWMAHDERDSDKFIVEYIFSLHESYQGRSMRIYVYVIFRPWVLHAMCP